jgi:hypothetical protein
MRRVSLKMLVGDCITLLLDIFVLSEQLVHEADVGGQVLLIVGNR